MKKEKNSHYWLNYTVIEKVSGKSSCGIDYERIRLKSSIHCL